MILGGYSSVSSIFDDIFPIASLSFFFFFITLKLPQNFSSYVNWVSAKIVRVGYASLRVKRLTWFVSILQVTISNQVCSGKVPNSCFLFFILKKRSPRTWLM